MNKIISLALLVGGIVLIINRIQRHQLLQLGRLQVLYGIADE